LQSRSGEWWAATKDGLCRYPAVKAAELLDRNPRICYGNHDDIFRVFEDSKGGIWASAQSPRGDELVRWDPATDRVFHFPAPRIPGGAADDLVSAFAEDRQGNIWMGLLKGGLYRYDGRRFQHFQQSDGMPGGAVSVLLAGESGLWIGSTGGLGNVVNTGDERPRIEIYDTARGMASDTVNCLVQDRQGRIYAGTAKGVDRLDPKTGHIRHFSSGLAHGDCTSAVRDRSGSLWFATKQGLSRLIPAEDRPAVHPRVFITDLRIGGVPHPVSQLGEALVSQLELKPSQNQLQVEFVGLDYEPGDVLRYSYKLDPADSEWGPPVSQLAVNYAALSAGKYRFLVKAVTSEGVESASPAGIEFTVLPPVWSRWWFEILAVALGAALVFAAHRYRVTQMVNLERMRTAIATDLHDDIGASLSHIAVLSEVARASVNGDDRRAQESLQRVAVLARELVDSLGDVVWSIRVVPDGLDSLVGRMREFALDLLAGQQIDFELRSPPAGQSVQHLSLQARRHLFLMFKESIHNVSRHSGCTAVKAELKVVEREILLTVEDNGRGLKPMGEPARWSGGNGIPGMRRRAETLGGSFQIVSTPCEGCTVSMRLPLRRGPFAHYRA
jgi:signal transduction histidine kinase/streptogramin lyase